MNKIIGALHKTLAFNRRTRVLARIVSDLLPVGSHVLDVGSGDGTTDALIMEMRPDVRIHGLDVLMRESTKIPVDPFDGKTLPCADKSFDVVTIIDVLHHTDDPTLLLREAKRVARSIVILKDLTMNGVLAYSTLCFMDWFGNAYDNVALPYNYWPERRWRETISELGMSIIHWNAKLKQYPFPASMIFDRHLHFVAVLAVA